MDTENFRKFGKWVEEGKKFFPEEANIEKVLNKARFLSYDNRDSKLRKRSLEYLKEIKENLQNLSSVNSISVRGKEGLLQTINEIEIELATLSRRGLFYNVLGLMEKIAEILIVEYKDSIENEFSHIKNSLEGDYFNLRTKISLLEKIQNSLQKTNLKKFISVLKLINQIRNKFLLHSVNYEDFRFVFGSESKKDSLLSKDMKQIKKSSEELLDLLDLSIEEEIVFHNCASFFSASENFIRTSKSNSQKFLVTKPIYEMVERWSSDLACACIIFLGRNRLNLA